VRVSIEFMGHMVVGSCDFCGPYHESDGGVVHTVEPANTDPDFLSDAAAAVEAIAYEKFKETVVEREHYDDRDGERADYYNHQVGPDYWIDSESGEPRCG